MRSRTLLPTAAAATVAVTMTYATVVERNWFALRRFDVPVLRPGAPPLRVLHLSDAHLTPRRHALARWIASLHRLDPDLVVSTGDSIAHADSVRMFLDALGPLLQRPGAFVFGSNDLYSPRPNNPARYLWRTSSSDRARKVPNLPWEKLGDGMAEAGWLDANNAAGRIRAGGLDVAVAGVHDPHIGRDRYHEVAGTADPAADLRLAVVHTPEPRLLDAFVADGYDLLLAGHTHGGQLRLPLMGALTTNCGIDRARARGPHRHPTGGGSGAQHTGAWLHVSAGLGTSPWAPARFACRPEATLLTLLPRAESG